MFNMKFISTGLCLLIGMSYISSADTIRMGQIFKVDKTNEEIKINTVSGQYDVKITPSTIIQKHTEISKAQALIDSTFVKVKGRFDKRFDKDGVSAYRIAEWLSLPENSNHQEIENKSFLQGKLVIENGIPILNVSGKRYFADSRGTRKYFKLNLTDRNDLKIRETVRVSGSASGNKMIADNIIMEYNEYAINENPSLPRVLLIGDSISMGYTSFVREEMKGKANIIRIPANGGPTDRLLSNYKSWLGPYGEDGFKWDIIHFNFGLHDLRVLKNNNYTALKKYEENLEKIIKILVETNAKLIWASTTPVPEDANKGSSWGEPNNADVIRYNDVAQRVMQQNNIAINDLYCTIFPVYHKYLQTPTNIHYNEEGSKILAKQVATKILQLLEVK